MVVVRCGEIECALSCFFFSKKEMMLWPCVVLSCLGTQEEQPSVSEGVTSEGTVSRLWGLANKTSQHLGFTLPLYTSATMSVRLRQVPGRSVSGGDRQQRDCPQLAARSDRATATIHPAAGTVTRSTLFTLSDRQECVDILQHVRCS